jgi:HEAT repeat protein
MNPEKLVRDLGHPTYGPIAQALLVQMGTRAVPALRACLLGPPAPEPEVPRMAAQALGAIGGDAAFAALIAALDHNVRGLALQDKLAEDAVRDAVAEELARLGGHRAVEPLLGCLRETHLPAAARALAVFREARAVPAMVQALEDSFVRERIADAIMRFGTAAVPDLMDTVEERKPRRGPEARWSADRRAAAARLLGEIGDAMAYPSLVPLLKDPDPSIRMEAAVALLRLGDERAFPAALPIVIAGLDGDAFLQHRCAEVLGRTIPWCIPPMVDAIAAGQVIVAGESVGLRPRALVALIDLLTGLRVSEARAALAEIAGHTDPLVRRKVSWALDQLRSAATA